MRTIACAEGVERTGCPMMSSTRYTNPQSGTLILPTASVLRQLLSAIFEKVAHIVEYTSNITPCTNDFP